MMVSFTWLFGNGSSSSGGDGGGGGWGAFAPNVGGWSGGGGFDSIGGGFGFGMGSGGGWSSGGDVEFGGGGGGGNWGDFEPIDDGFTNSDALGGYAGTTSDYDSITTLDTVTVVGDKSDQTRSNIRSLFDESPSQRTPAVWDGSGEVPTISYWQDGGVTVIAPRPKPEPESPTDAQIRDQIARDQRWILESFTGEIGGIWSGLKALVNRDWWGAGLGLAGLGLGPTLRIGGKVIRNSSLAGDVHPVTGIPFKTTGFPDFSGVAIKEVKITQTGVRHVDFDAANRAAGLDSTPPGYVWHHVEDGTTMQLVSSDIHRLTGHTGGVGLSGVK